MQGRRVSLATMKTLFIVATTVCLLALASGCDEPTTPTPDASADAVADSADAGSETDSTSADADGGSEDAEPPRPDLQWPVTERGPYNAGHRTIEMSYAPSGLATDGLRPLVVHLYYPTTDTTGESPKYINLFELEYSFEKASLAPPAVGQEYPLHLFSHGHQGFAGATARNLSFLATHGWVVAAPDHTGNLLTDGGDRDNAIYFLRSQDISAILDHLAGLESSDPLAGKLDTGNTVLSGHSFGGYTAYTMGGAAWDLEKLTADCAAGAGFGGDPCTVEETTAFEAGAKDSRIKGIFAMAAGDRNKFGATGLAAIDVPVMMMTGDEDASLSSASAAEIWGLLPSGATWVDIAGACHQTFAIGGCAVLKDEPGYAIVDAYLLAFSRAHVLGDSSVADILDGTTEIAAEVTFQTK